MIKSKPKVKKSTVAISERNRVALAYLELARDKVFQKLSEEDKVKIIKEAQAIGVEAAGWVATEYGMDDPRKIAVKMGLRVFGEDKQSGGTSEYRRNRRSFPSACSSWSWPSNCSITSKPSGSARFTSDSNSQFGESAHLSGKRRSGA